MPSKRRLVTSEICFGTEKAGLMDFSYNKCALAPSNSVLYCGDSIIDIMYMYIFLT